MGYPDTKKIELGRWGTWEFSLSRHQITFWNEQGVYREYDNHVLLRQGWMDWCTYSCPTTGLTLLLEREGNVLFRLDAQDGQISEEATLNRYSERDDEGFFRCSFSTYEKYIFLVYEVGILCLNSAGHLKWRHEFLKLDAFYKGVEDSIVVYGYQSGQRWGYRIEDGLEIELPPENS